MSKYERRVEYLTEQLDKELASLQIRAQALRMKFGGCTPHQDDWDDTLDEVLEHVREAIFNVNKAAFALDEGS